MIEKLSDHAGSVIETRKINEIIDVLNRLEKLKAANCGDPNCKHCN